MFAVLESNLTQILVSVKWEGFNKFFNAFAYTQSKNQKEWERVHGSNSKNFK